MSDRVARWWAAARATDKAWVYGLSVLWWVLWLVYGYAVWHHWSDDVRGVMVLVVLLVSICERLVRRRIERRITAEGADPPTDPAG